MDVTVTQRATREQILEFVTVDAVKRSARVTHNRENEFIEDKIVAAYGYLNGVNGWTNGYFMLEETVEVYASTFDAVLELTPRPIVDEAILFERRLADGTYDVVPPTFYALARRDECVVLLNQVRTTFRAPVNDPHPRSYRMTFKVGHADRKDVPESLRSAIILLAGHYYANREAAFPDPRTGNVSREIAFGVKSQAGRFRFKKDHS